MNVNMIHSGIFYFVGRTIDSFHHFRMGDGHFFSMTVAALFDVFRLSNGLIHLPTLP